MTFSPSGSYLALVSYEGELAIYHAPSRTLVASYPIGIHNTGLIAFDTEDTVVVMLHQTEAFALRWTIPAGAIDATWRSRMPFEAAGLEVRTKPPAGTRTELP